MFAWSDLGWHLVATWFGIAVDYLKAAVAIGAGFYLAEFFNLQPTNPLAWLLRPLRYFGYALIVVGTAYGYGTWREQNAVNDCVSAERLASVASERDAARSEVAGWRRTADVNRQQADRLQVEKGKIDARLASWKASAAKAAKGTRDARAITGDDARRLCGIVEDAAAGCKLR